MTDRKLIRVLLVLNYEELFYTACQSALQPLVNLGLLYNQSPLLGSEQNLFFTGWGY
jgi:hypothetical protein